LTALASVPSRQAAELELFSFAWPEGRLRESTQGFASLLGAAGSELNGRSLVDLAFPEDRDALAAGFAALGDRGDTPPTFETRFLRSDGGTVYVEWVARPGDDAGTWRASGIDTGDLFRLLADRRDLRTRLDLAIGQATAAMWDFDVSAGLLNWEPQAAEIFGLAPDGLPGDPAALAAIVHAEDREAVRAAFDMLLHTGTTDVGMRVGRGGAMRHLSLRGRVLDRAAAGTPMRVVGLLLDVTTEKAMEEQLLRMSVSDALTGVPNRRAFDQALRAEWRRCARAGEPLSVVMVDIDAFKAFNDTFGHLVGDQALISVGRALAAQVLSGRGLLARYGGEEFAIVLPGAEVSEALAVGRSLVEAAGGVRLRQASDWTMSVSVGTASCRPEEATFKPADLIGRADQALYSAKSAGKNRALAYEEFLAARDQLRSDISAGLRNGEFVLSYQPVVSLRDRSVLGFEALMRWERPGHGLVPPAEFIPVAETSSLICDLGRFALREAAMQLASWLEAGLDCGGELNVAVNISARHASSSSIVDHVREALEVSGLDGGRLELELTETALQQGSHAVRQLARVRSLGVCVAIDDFGTGYTSIGELSRLPADVLKVDRAFVASTDPRQRILVQLMTEAAHAFDLRVVAEGVEDEPTFAAMRELGCDDAQGYLIARPMPAAQATEWLAGACAG
jgi:diguanylate cyclase (GGDEF)-like protein/PAS domain S-box-containing protein